MGDSSKDTRRVMFTQSLFAYMHLGHLSVGRPTRLGLLVQHFEVIFKHILVGAVESPSNHFRRRRLRVAIPTVRFSKSTEELLLLLL